MAVDDDIINLKTAARILHFYIRDILEKPDLPDITPAAVLRDLYDCRICVNAIAQMYLRGIMEPVSLPLPGASDSGGLLLFEGERPITEKDARDAIGRAGGIS